MSDFNFTHNYAWIGNYVLSFIGLVVLFYCAARKNRPNWLLGVAVFEILFLILFALAVVSDANSQPSMFSTPFILCWYSGLPVQTVFNDILGEDNFVEEHLMLPTALLMWGLVGALLAAALAKILKLVGYDKQSATKNEGEPDVDPKA